MTFIFSLLLAMAMTMTFFGKSIIGIAMGVMVVTSLVMHWRVLTKDNLFKTMRAPETIAILAMVIAWFASAAHGMIPEKSVKEVAEYAGIILGGYLIFGAFYTKHSDGDSLKTVPFMKYTTIGGALCAGLLSLTPFFGLEWSSSYGSVLTILMPMAVYLARENKYWWIAVLIIASGIIASGGRTAWVALACLMILIPALMPQRSFRHIVMMIAVFIIGAGVGLLSYKHQIDETLFEIRLESMTSMDRPASGRLTVWQDAWENIEHRPFLGYGIKSTPYLDLSKGKGETVIHPHNVVLEMILETGALGFLAFMSVIAVFVFKFLRAYWRSNDRNMKSQAMVIFLSCIAYGICSMALTSIFHAWWFLYLVVLLILLKVMELKLAPQAS